MSKRIAWSDAAALAAIQRLSRHEAESELVAARLAEESAAAKATQAHAAEDDAEGAWQALLSEPRFAPEWSRALASRLIERQAGARSADQAAHDATAVYDSRQDAWRAADARLRSTEAILRRARRTAERKREEKRLDALANRITLGWSHP